MEFPTDWSLRVRMAATLVAFVVFLVTFLGLLTAVPAVLLWGVGGYESPTLVLGLSAGATALAVGVVLQREHDSAGPLAVRGVDVEPADVAHRPELSEILARLAQQADLPAPAVPVADVEVPTAFTTGLTRRGTTVVLTRGLLDRLSDAELRAVLAHELAHLRNRDAEVVTLVSYPLVVAETMTRWGDRASADDERALGALVVYLVAGGFWLWGRVVVRALSRHRELAADRSAAALTGDPAALASALRTIEGADAPTRDLRAVEGATEAFGVLPVERDPEPVRLGPDGERLPLHDRLKQPFRPLARRFLGTHPPLERRLAALAEIEAELETPE